MTAKQPAVKKYIVRLSTDERERRNTLIQKGKAPARQRLKARILLKADASEAGEAWSDSEIAAALDTSIDRRRGCIDPPTLTQLGAQTHLRRRRRGQADRARLFPAPQRTQALDADAAGKRGGGVEYRRSCE